ncbi:MAG: penicillin-binding protein 2 [Deltaproteobacteria bacterium]|nr:penicillin-binding protein 2 [Deltaproteobacteria bacterium]
MKDFFSEKEPRELKARVFMAIWAVLAIFSILVGRLWHLQVINAAHYKDLSRNNSIRLTKNRAPRGVIFDRNGVRLAENRPGFDLSIIPEDVRDWEKTKRLLVRLADIDEKTIEERLEKEKGRPPYRAIKLKEDLSWEEMVRVASYKFELHGVSIDVGAKRLYQYHEATAHLLGYLGEISESEYAEFRKTEENPYSPGDMIGKAGIEVSFENDLMGVDGGRQVEVDVQGRLMRVVKNIYPYPGNNMRLTIDHATQMAAWEAMKDKAGAVIAMDPLSGRILAMVSTPAYDPNTFVDGVSREEWNGIVENPLKVLTNRVIHGQYPPASTFKPLTAAAALDSGVIKPETMIYSGPSFRYGNREYRDWKEEGHGTIGVHRAIVESADTFFYQVGLKLGVDRIAAYARQFGLGEKTGVELRNEKSGLVADSSWKRKVLRDRWYEGETISVSVGQGYTLVTPLQLLNAYSAIANGGTLFVPQFVDGIETPEGRRIRGFTPLVKGRLNVSEKTLEFVREALRGVVTEDGGTARGLNVDGLGIAGKTGTAQVSTMKERVKNILSLPYRLRDHAWFVGFAPYDDPKIAVAVIVEHGGFGASAAAPVALKVIKAYLEKKPDGEARGAAGADPAHDAAGGEGL